MIKSASQVWYSPITHTASLNRVTQVTYQGVVLPKSADRNSPPWSETLTCEHTMHTTPRAAAECASKIWQKLAD